MSEIILQKALIYWQAYSPAVWMAVGWLIPKALDYKFGKAKDKSLMGFFEYAWKMKKKEDKAKLSVVKNDEPKA